MKVVFVTGMLPSGHYSQYIAHGLVETKKVELLVYTDKDEKNLIIKGCGQIIPVWSKSFKFIFEVLKQLRQDKPDIVHFQHELNMYGGMFTAALFPLLLLLTKLLGYKIVVTVHAAVFKKQIDDEFVRIFNQNPKIIRPFMLKTFFSYVYHSISLISNIMIVHTHLTKKIITQDYGVDGTKVHVIPAVIPEKKPYTGKTDPYFFYFGYMARRKGLGYALDGFKKYIETNPKSKFKLILAGGVIKGQEDSLREITDMITKSGLEQRIVYKGFIEEKAQDDLYHKAYCVIIPAVLSMGSSGPLYHANSYGKCIIATKIGHYLEDIDDGKTGILTDNDKWDQAFDMVVNNPSQVKQIEKNTMQKATDRKPITIARQYNSIYSQLINRN
ncbi:MAG: Lipopolysaccharide N-acetylglucosaminyltransferase [Parcubacteria group bacterium GW2011_GWB1_40_14]|nr:MAG: Lipopolysaccharide N-acetylglucosaminyltransferase [Parcubacteria group bacterium GW2011_GWB1_40_14]